MKNKLFLGIVGFLLASSTMFAGWGVGFGAGWYGVPGIAYARPVHEYYHRGWIRPYVGAYLAPLPYAVPYVAPAPYIDTTSVLRHFSVPFGYRDAGCTARMEDIG